MVFLEGRLLKRILERVPSLITPETTGLLKEIDPSVWDPEWMTIGVVGKDSDTCVTPVEPLGSLWKAEFAATPAARGRRIKEILIAKAGKKDLLPIVKIISFTKEEIFQIAGWFKISVPKGTDSMGILALIKQHFQITPLA